MSSFRSSVIYERVQNPILDPTPLSRVDEARTGRNTSSAKAAARIQRGGYFSTDPRDLHVRPGGGSCRLAGADDSRVRSGGEPVEDDAEMPFEPLVAVVVEVSSLLHQ